MSSFSKNRFLEHLRPLHVVSLVACYLLGGGLARHLGVLVDWSAFLIGLLWSVFTALGFFMLADRFQTGERLGLLLRLPFQPDRDAEQTEETEPVELIYLAASLLAAAAVTSLFIFRLPVFSIETAFLMMVFFGGLFLLTAPGIQFANSGFTEPLTSFLLVLIPPALGYTLQTGEYHRFLALSVFPLYPLHLAMLLFWQLPEYPRDLRLGRKTLMIRLGWLQGIFVHNLLVLTGFLLFGAGVLFGFPARIGWPILLVLPLAGYLIWYLSRLKDGAPTRWLPLSLLSGSIYYLPVYLITYSYWIR